MELSTDYQKFGLKIKHRLSTDYQKSENSQLVTFLLRCLYTILSVLNGDLKTGEREEEEKSFLELPQTTSGS